jgi:hypothetical protein
MHAEAEAIERLLVQVPDEGQAQKDAAAGPHDAREFTEDADRVVDVFEDLAANDLVEAAVSEREMMQVGDGRDLEFPCGSPTPRSTP